MSEGQPSDPFGLPNRGQPACKTCAALRLQLAERGSELKALESRNAQLHDQVEYQAHEIEDLRRQLEVALLPTS